MKTIKKINLWLLMMILCIFVAYAVPAPPPAPASFDNTASNPVDGGSSGGSSGGGSSYTCGDSTVNGDETDIDCGGSCEPCATAKKCKINDDCVSSFCNKYLKCAVPTCNDGVKNGAETGIDCGGQCGSCVRRYNPISTQSQRPDASNSDNPQNNNPAVSEGIMLSPSDDLGEEGNGKTFMWYAAGGILLLIASIILVVMIHNKNNNDMPQNISQQQPIQNNGQLRLDQQQNANKAYNATQNSIKDNQMNLQGIQQNNLQSNNNISTQPNPGLVNYIRSNLAKGHTLMQLRHVLIEHGWRQDMVDSSINYIREKYLNNSIMNKFQRGAM